MHVPRPSSPGATKHLMQRPHAQSALRYSQPLTQLQGALLHKVQQAPRGGHNDVRLQGALGVEQTDAQPKHATTTDGGCEKRLSPKLTMPVQFRCRRPWPHTRPHLLAQRL